MATRLFHELKALGREYKVLAGSFAPAGTAAPTSVKGEGYTVARTSTGLYTLTMADKYNDLICALVSPQFATATTQVLQADLYTAASKTLTIKNITAAGTVTDIAANASNRVNFLLVFENTAVQ